MMSSLISPVSESKRIRLYDVLGPMPWDVFGPLTVGERSELSDFMAGKPVTSSTFPRLLGPIRMLSQTWPSTWQEFVRALLRRVHECDKSFWQWTDDEWCSNLLKIRSEGKPYGASLSTLLPLLVAPNGLLNLHPDLLDHKGLHSTAKRVFGEAFIDLEERVRMTLLDLGYSVERQQLICQKQALAKLVCLSGRVRLESSDAEISARIAKASGKSARSGMYSVHHALHVMGIFEQSAPDFYGSKPNDGHVQITRWHDDIEYWREHQVRHEHRSNRRAANLIRSIAAWFDRNVPDASSPSKLIEAHIVQFRTAVLKANHGDFSTPEMFKTKKTGALKARTRSSLLYGLNTFISDLVDMKRLPPAFVYYAKLLKVPEFVRRQIGPDPRIIEDAAYAKLITAALELDPEDTKQMSYPYEFVRALAFVWVFGGMRSDEIMRLSPTCIEDRRAGIEDADDIVWLRVPANKFKPEFVKPVCTEVGDAVKAWLAVRPKLEVETVDPKTLRKTRHLFVYRGRLVGQKYVNSHIVPLLLRKAGLVGYKDRHGTISVHRARATITTHLGTGPNAMTLAALKEWLGHTDVSTTLAYLATTPVELGRQYRAAHKFGVTVHVDLDAVHAGQKAGPWRFTEVAGGLCSYEPFKTCPNNMACLQDACEHHVPASEPLVKRLKAGERALRFIEEIELEPVQIRKSPGKAKRKKSK